MESTRVCRGPDDMREGGFTIQYRRTWHNDSVLKGGIEVAIWRYICEMAEHKPRMRRSAGRCPIEVLVDRGELIVTYRGLAKFFEISRDRLKRLLTRLERTNRITIRDADSSHDRTTSRHKPHSIGLVIKVLNYDIYQHPPKDLSTPSEPPVDHESDSLTKKRRKEESRDSESPKRDSPSSPGGDLFADQTEVDPESSQTVPITPKPSATRLSQQMCMAWNEICGDVLPQVKAISDTRLKLLKLRYVGKLKGPDKMRSWREFCERVRASPHLTGDNERGWTAGIDWCLKLANWVKIEEGNYDAKARRGQFDELLRRWDAEARVATSVDPFVAALPPPGPPGKRTNGSGSYHGRDHNGSGP